MPMIYVKARPGRRAFFEGKVIPEDKFIPVTDTPYIRRLVQHWEDLEVEGGELPKPGQKPVGTASRQGREPSSPSRPTAPRPASPLSSKPATE
jgi:hypothetical protein